MDEAARVLAECLNSWRRGPYPKTSSYVPAHAPTNDSEDPRWVRDVNNIVDLQRAMEMLTYRQREALYRYVVLGQGQSIIGAGIGISQRAVGIELETACEELMKWL